VIAKTKVCDCKNCWFISVTVKGQKETEPVCDCNYLACVIATRSYVWFAKKRKPDFDCVVEKNKNTDEARKLNCKKQDFWQ
jgi:hypothetical protein